MKMIIYAELKIIEDEIREDTHAFNIMHFDEKPITDKCLDFSSEKFTTEQIKLKTYQKGFGGDCFKIGESQKFKNQIDRYLETIGFNDKMRRLESDNRALALQNLALTIQLSKKNISLWGKVKSIFKKGVKNGK